MLGDLGDIVAAESALEAQDAEEEELIEEARPAPRRRRRRRSRPRVIYRWIRPRRDENDDVTQGCLIGIAVGVVLLVLAGAGGVLYLSGGAPEVWFFAVWASAAFAGLILGDSKECGALGGFLLGLFLSWLGVLIVACFPRAQPRVAFECPRCGEDTPEQAMACWRCGCRFE